MTPAPRQSDAPRTELDAALDAPLDAVRGLDITARAVAERWRHGRHAALAPGDADEFFEFRRAGPADFPTRPDWRASARRDEPVLRVRRRHAAMTVAIVVDASASMGFRGLHADSRSPSKLDDARLLAATLIATLLTRGDRARLLTDDHQPPTTFDGRAALTSACQRLQRLTPAGDTPLSALLDHAARALPQADLIVAVGDALEPVLDLTHAASRAARRRAGPRDLALLRILTPDEARPPVIPGAVVDPETGVRADLADPASANLAADTIANHGRALHRIFAGPGRRFALHTVGADPAATLTRAFAARP